MRKWFVHFLIKLYSHLCSQQALVKRKQGFVDGEDIVVFLLDEILDDDVELTAAAQRKTGTGNKVLRFLQIQLQGDGKGDCRCLGRLVVWVVADLGKQFAVHIGLFVDLRIFFCRCGR